MCPGIKQTSKNVLKTFKRHIGIHNSIQLFSTVDQLTGRPLTVVSCWRCCYEQQTKCNFFLNVSSSLQLFATIQASSYTTFCIYTPIRFTKLENSYYTISWDKMNLWIIQTLAIVCNIRWRVCYHLIQFVQLNYVTLTMCTIE